MIFLETARRVRAGVRLLDKKIPGWRHVLRRHVEQFDFADGDHCVLGTLEHYSGRMKVLARKHREHDDYSRFDSALKALGIKDEVGFGFDCANRFQGWEEEGALLDALWRAEFEKETRP